MTATLLCNCLPAHRTFGERIDNIEREETLARVPLARPLEPNLRLREKQRHPAELPSSSCLTKAILCLQTGL
jgi:hypothetical protein